MDEPLLLGEIVSTGPLRPAKGRVDQAEPDQSATFCEGVVNSPPNHTFAASQKRAVTGPFRPEMGWKVEEESEKEMMLGEVVPEIESKDPPM